MVTWPPRCDRCRKPGLPSEDLLDRKGGDELPQQPPELVRRRGAHEVLHRLGVSSDNDARRRLLGIDASLDGQGDLVGIGGARYARLVLPAQAFESGAV